MSSAHRTHLFIPLPGNHARGSNPCRSACGKHTAEYDDRSAPGYFRVTHFAILALHPCPECARYILTHVSYKLRKFAYQNLASRVNLPPLPVMTDSDTTDDDQE